MILENIFLKDSLYRQYNLNSLTEKELLDILFYHENSGFNDKSKTLDSYCPICKKDTTFISQNTDKQIFNEVMSILQERAISSNRINGIANDDGAYLKKILEEVGTFERVFKCPRPSSDKNHDQIYVFRIKDSSLIKIGQSPAIADLERRNIEKYRNLDENIYQELNRAIGLSTHGIGVGSFVYLRRIIEKHIVIPNLQNLLDSQQITLEDFNSDFKKKIDLAKDLIPEFLVSNKKIYSILSKGVHELEEQECLDFFPILKVSIEIILDQKIEQVERDKKNKIISQELNKFQ
jgi:hypothetical protein